MDRRNFIKGTAALGGTLGSVFGSGSGAGLGARLVGGLAPGALWLEAVSEAAAGPLEYNLKADLIAPGTYVVIGPTEYFSHENGGNIVNTAFVDTDDGVVVIDTGPSLRYGNELRRLIKKTINKDIVRVYITHHHPDHFLGNQAFDQDHIASLPKVISNIKAEGEAFVENMYRLEGDWMRGTQVVLPKVALKSSEIIGGHAFEVLPLGGHTSADMAILDAKTGVLFAGDLAFLDRAPTTPHADLARWHKSLGALEKIKHDVLVPGHGPAEGGGRAIAQTRDYLKWLETMMRSSIDQGLNMTDIMATPIPERFSSISVLPGEMQRSVAHLYRAMEEDLLPLVSKGGG